ncbi:undecaprenyldiphospho-muramoylpentapeptide beta-N-acetylglucosaminyltransferase [Desulfarculus baarsii]
MKRSVLIAGGGTGGHLFPGVAVANELKRQSPGLELAFVSAGKALESRLLREAGLPLESLPASAFVGGGLVGRFKALAKVPLAVAKASAIISRRRPGLVLAVGGYAALPLGLAAWLRGAPLAVQEQNAAPGLTNRVLARLARVVFTSFPGAEEQLPAAKCRMVGNPVRAELLAQAQAAAAQRPPAAEEFRVLVLGGSQGARSINKAVTGALALLAQRLPRLAFIHQTGQADEQWVQKAYQDAGARGQAAAFFGDVGRLYGWAHLVICRAGAGTLTEALACGRAAVCVPYPHAAADHQTKNARALVAAGAARLIADHDFDAAAAARVIAEMIDDEPARAQFERRALALARPGAAAEIARQCLEIMGEADHV